MKKILTWHLPLRTASENNSTEHWTKKAKRHRMQKLCIKKAFLTERPKIQFPIHVVLSRIAPRKLDFHDNLPSSFKWIVDSLADCLLPGKQAGRSDDSKLITWKYKQEKGKAHEYAVKIEIMQLEKE